MAVSAPADGPTFAGIEGHLAALDGRTRALARRSRRFSWFCWGFLFGGYGGIALASVISVLFPVVTTTVTASGTSTSTTGPWWALPVSLIPGIVLFTLAVRELVLGRREAKRGTVAPRPPSGLGPEEIWGGWTETVQRCQQRVTHSKSEVEWSFVPLVLGWFAFVELAVISVMEYFPPSASGPWFILAGPLVALVSLVGLWPFYRAAKGWVAGYQVLLDRQVGELSKLEAEFLWRFAGMGLPA